MKTNKWLCSCMIVALCLFSICTTAFANNNNVKVASKLDAKDVKNIIVTTVTIQDVKSGFVSSYNVEDENIKCSRSADGKEIIAIISVGDEKASAKRAPSQTNSNTFYGWKGNARISWYDDGTWACLKTAGGDWTKISGNYNMTGKKIVWGQDLGTNSKSSSATFINSYNTTTNWPKGKYGYGLGHKVGAYISGTVNGKKVSVSCNYVF